MHLDGAPLVEESLQRDNPSHASAPERKIRETREENDEPAHLTEEDVAALPPVLTEYFRPATGILIE